MQFDSYDEVPPNIAEKVVGERTGDACRRLVSVPSNEF